MIFRRKFVLRYLLMWAMLAFLLFLSSLWLHQEEVGDCGPAGHPCRRVSHKNQKPISLPEKWAGPDIAPHLIKECPGQTFQASQLLTFLKASLSDEDDVLLGPYLQSWDQLISFMESLGTVVGFFSQKVIEKVSLIRELSLKHAAETRWNSGLQTIASFGLDTGMYRSVRSMVEAELKAGVVNFSWRTDSGCRTLLRLHRSQLWLKLMLEGLTEPPDAEGRFKTPGELCRDAYQVALAPHHPWMLRQAAELVFHALPDRKYFLQLVCVQSQSEAVPVLRVIIHALTLVHARTQRVLEEHGMLELP
ncbi:ceramide-1-phosphate transfer protein [Synchiropus splendidus]|uniref:ceramide-1-phosphate transfer protein n=1 Tax=Synchiropus splendidus TaxID=270530 RepID=UPI00237D76F7|nr:ceramide-1-phosphate transfer protein [Synchiropus splendidus]